MKKKRSVTPHGDAIRSARLRKAWTTDALSERADCHIKTIENAERGKAIYANTLASIASALGVEYDSLIARQVEQKKPVEPKKPTKRDLMVATTPIEATFGILARKNQRIKTAWFLDQLRSHMAFQDAVEGVSNRYGQTPAIPDGGVWITLKMTVRDFDQVYAFFCAKNNPDEPFLKVLVLGAQTIPDTYIHNTNLWISPLIWYQPPHSHLYE